MNAKFPLPVSCCALLLAAAAFPATTLAQDAADHPAAPEFVQLDGWGPPPPVVDRGNAVQAEVDALASHEWAGEYYAGDGLGMNVRVLVSPTAGVAATWHGCMGLYGSNEGTIEPQPDGSLKFAFHKPNAHRFGGFADAVLPVRWGERRYLIATDELDEFVSAVNFGREPRDGAHGYFLLADGDADKPALGLPELPEPYRSRIRHEALIVPVASVTPLETTQQDGWCEATYRISLPRGTDDGIGPHSSLQVAAPDNAMETLRLDGATRHTSQGIVRTSASTCAQLLVPDKNWTFTTGAYKPKPPAMPE